MLNLHRIIISIATAILAFYSLSAQEKGAEKENHKYSQEIRQAIRLFDEGMYSRARGMFEECAEEYGSDDAYGYAVLCDVIMNLPGYELRMNNFIKYHPYSFLIPEIRYQHALKLFDRKDYVEASRIFSQLKLKQLRKTSRTEFIFKSAYCALEMEDYDSAQGGFEQVEKLPVSEFTSASRYALGYINYRKNNFEEALPWFEGASADPRFSSVSKWYMMECRFMMEDYAYVTQNADKMYDAVPEDRKQALARLVSESYLVLGDADNARKYFELSGSVAESKTRSDWYYSGSVLYAVGDYQGAVACFANMENRADSLGQVANYKSGYSYIRTKNKVAAMKAFKDASLVEFDADITEDALFNYAKLAFDLNNDRSVFEEYLSKYSHERKGDRIYSYIAVAALHERDYSGAISAYDQIETLDDDMVSNYIKANYLRAAQLIENGSYRKAIPCLKAVIYYTSRGSRLNQLSRYWLAEAEYRNDEYAASRQKFTELYNVSALFGTAENKLLPYNVAYCFFKEKKFDNAVKWFNEYLSQDIVKYRKEALERKGDCFYVMRNYKAASDVYESILMDYFDVNDIYPYYYAALSHGLNNNSDRKIELLSNVLNASAESDFYAEALFELGRTYSVKEKNEKAFECFNKLIETVKDSVYIARANIEMGSISRNQSQFDEALGYYKTVIEQMPLSGYVDDALLAVESIYQTQGRSEEYITYIENIGKGNIRTEDEKENMIFNSAEQVFLSENYQKALTSLQSYKSKYPSGANVFKADFYIAESYKALGKKEQACDSYEEVINKGEGSFVELSMLNFAVLSYQLERWDDSFGAYQSLHSSAKLENNKYTALVGMMRAAYRGKNWANVISAAQGVKADSRADEQMKQEADFLMAKSYLAMSNREEAMAILSTLSSDLNSEYGAEAAYMLIVDSYDQGKFSEVEEKVYAFSDAGSSQTYWLAKSFVVLGDSFVERDEFAQAKATFESVLEGYSPEEGQSDDVADNVKMRLEKLQELIEKQNN